MRHARYVFVPLALIVFMGTAEAQVPDRHGWSINGGVGGAVIRDKDGSVTFRGSSFAYNAGIEYRTRSSIAVGFGYFDLGTANDTISGVNTDISVDGIDFTLRFIFQPGGKAEWYALTGGALYYPDVSTGGSFVFIGQGAFALGGGLDYHVSERTAIRFQARFLNGERDESGGFATIGFNLRF